MLWQDRHVEVQTNDLLSLSCCRCCCSYMHCLYLPDSFGSCLVSVVPTRPPMVVILERCTWIRKVLSFWWAYVSRRTTEILPAGQFQTHY